MNGGQGAPYLHVSCQRPGISAYLGWRINPKREALVRDSNPKPQRVRV
jgi:hypothetical protein